MLLSRAADGHLATKGEKLAQNEADRMNSRDEGM